MKREEFLNILKEENVEFCVNEDLDVMIRAEFVLLHMDYGGEDAFIIPDKSFNDLGIFATTQEKTPLYKVTREDVMKMVEAYRKTNM